MESNIKIKAVKNFICDVFGISKEELKKAEVYLSKYNYYDGGYEFEELELKDSKTLGDLIGSNGDLRFDHPMQIECIYRYSGYDNITLEKRLVLDQKYCSYRYEEVEFYDDAHGRRYFDQVAMHAENLSEKMQKYFMEQDSGYAKALIEDNEQEHRYFYNKTESEIENYRSNIEHVKSLLKITSKKIEKSTMAAEAFLQKNSQPGEE